MKLLIIPSIVFFLCTSSVVAENVHIPEIHSKHFFYGYPSGTPLTNDMIIRDIYALSNNDKTKFADWVAYRLDKETIDGDVKTSRKWKADPWLEDEETIEPSDYIGAFNKLNTDRGHQAPLASFKGTKYWSDTNYLSNITPQSSDLNRGAWLKLENKIRKLVRKSNQPVYIITGPIYNNKMETLPNADELHIIPYAYWKIIIIQEKPNDIKSIQTASFLFFQSTPRKSPILKHLVTIDEIENKTGLNFLRLLPIIVEEVIEGKYNASWAEKVLSN